MELLDGKKLSQTIKDEIAQKVRQLKADGNKTPHLAAILVGNDGASETYVAHKVKACKEVGFKSTLIRFDKDTTEQELIAQIYLLNNDDDIDGFIVQLPLPGHIDEQRVVQAIDPNKDVDGFHPVNVGKMVKNLPCFLPATPFGILTLLERYQVETSGKQCVVIGRSDIVGKPMSILMSRKASPGNCTVTLCHSATQDLKKEIQRADIIIAALGKPEFITGDMVKKGATVIDVGITRVRDETKKSGYALKGDVKFDEVSKKAGFITPVPGGVGPMTVASLLLNTLQAAEDKKII